MDQDSQPTTSGDIEVSSLRATRSSGAPVRRLIISVAALLLALLVVFAGLAGLPQTAIARFITSPPTHTPSHAPTPVVPEPTFLTTDIAVIAPSPAHAGDAVTVVIRLRAAYDGRDALRAYYFSTTSTL